MTVVACARGTTFSSGYESGAEGSGSLATTTSIWSARDRSSLREGWRTEVFAMIWLRRSEMERCDLVGAAAEGAVYAGGSIAIDKGCLPSAIVVVVVAATRCRTRYLPL